MNRLAAHAAGLARTRSLARCQQRTFAAAVGTWMFMSMGGCCSGSTLLQAI